MVQSLQAEVDSLRKQVAQLTNDAEAGRTYRQARVDEAIKQGIRSYGEHFDEANHRAYYTDLPMDELEKHIAYNKKMGDAALPAGRRTSDSHAPPSEDFKP